MGGRISEMRDRTPPSVTPAMLHDSRNRTYRLLEMRELAVVMVLTVMATSSAIDVRRTAAIGEGGVSMAVEKMAVAMGIAEEMTATGTAIVGVVVAIATPGIATVAATAVTVAMAKAVVSMATVIVVVEAVAGVIAEIGTRTDAVVSVMAVAETGEATMVPGVALMLSLLMVVEVDAMEISAAAMGTRKVGMA
jgi:hypothetical protein